MSGLQTYFLQVCAAGLLALGGTAGSAAAAAEAAAPAAVTIKDFMFAPVTLTVKAGTLVTWVNRDDEPHTIFSDTGLFRSGALDTGGDFHFKFDQPGTYHYLCTIHPHMVGTIIVEQ